MDNFVQSTAERGARLDYREPLRSREIIKFALNFQVSSTNRKTHLDAFLTANRLEETEVTGDGNCLIRAIACSYAGDENLHLALRKDAHAFVVDNQGLFFDFFPNEIMPSKHASHTTGNFPPVDSAEPRSFAEFLTRLSEPGRWNSEADGAAICQTLGINLWIYRKDTGIALRCGPEFETDTCYVIIYNGQDHYSGTTRFTEKPPTMNSTQLNVNEPSSSLTVLQLKEQLRKRSLPLTGCKETLSKRLNSNIAPIFMLKETVVESNLQEPVPIIRNLLCSGKRLCTLTCIELKTKLRQLNLTIGGNKKTLFDRLEQHLLANSHQNKQTCDGESEFETALPVPLLELNMDCDTDYDADDCQYEDQNTDCQDENVLVPESTLRQRRRKVVRNIKPAMHYDALNFTKIYPAELSLGRMDFVCRGCNALHFVGERTGVDLDIFSSCCHKGKVVLQMPKDFPPELRDLLERKHHLSTALFHHIRNYNGAMAFASIVSDIDVVPGHGPPVYRISGQIYHFIGPVQPDDGQPPCCGQIYFLNANEALNPRSSYPANTSLDRELLTTLEWIMRHYNPYADAYKMMREIEVEENARAIHEGRDALEVRIVFDNDRRQTDQRRYNLPTSNEVAAIIVGAGDDNFPSHALVIHKRGSPLRKISILNKDSDPMSYPLLFPGGDFGWAPYMKNPDGKNISMLQFYAYRIAQRKDTFNAILHGGLLFQQYLVDSYVKVEQSRLDFQKKNQRVLQADNYQGLSDFLATKALTNNVIPGRTIVLSPSFVGGKRYMQQSYQDAMAVCREFGKPDIFLTITANPKWNEILDNLLAGQSAADRPDLVAKVFKLKLEQLMEDLLKNQIFGKIKAYLLVIEFQKRGLPHCHMLIILAQEDKFLESDSIDKVVSCEIPDKNDNPRLYEIIRKMMIHGPCGPEFNMNTPCMTDAKGKVCKKKYPHDFQEVTSVNANGYPLYRRRDTGRTMTVGPHEIDNRWVVPHNPYLLLKYNAHINVEICSTVKSCKYLYKYILKGSDRARIRMTVIDGQKQPVMDVDEIGEYLDSRYIGAPEAVWKLSEYEMSKKSHAVVRLSLHLPNKQPVMFEPGEEEDAILTSSDKLTTLTAWFQLNCSDSAAHAILYHNIPLSYTFQPKERKWNKRLRNTENVIGRMYTTSPGKDMELFCLRVLLLNVPGATGYEFLRTVEGVVFPTFREAALALNLLEDDSEWIKCLQDAAFTKMPTAIRQLFAVILVYGCPTNPNQLWEQFKEDMSEDYLRTMDEESSVYHAYQDIQQATKAWGKSLAYDFAIPVPPEGVPIAPVPEFDVENETRLGAKMYNQLNLEQKAIADEILKAVQSDQPTGKCIFIDAPGGTGKTFLLTAMYHILAGKQINPISVAWSGIAANLLPKGSTVHSRFGIPIVVNEKTEMMITGQSKRATALRESSVIFWDEAPMATREVLEMIDRGMRKLGDPLQPFGGKIMVLGGDFRQVLPVVPRGGQTAQVKASIKKSPLWRLFEIRRLTNNVRVNADETKFSKWLLELGNDTLPKEDGKIEIPSTCLSDNIIRDVYGNSISLEDETVIGKVILCPTNVQTFHLNSQILELLPGPSKTYASVDLTINDDNENDIGFPQEFLHTLTPNGLPPHILRLKVGAVVILLRNLNIEKGLCNGARLVVKRMYTSLLDCELMSGILQGQRVLIPRIKLQPTGEQLPFDFRRLQFPIRLAFAMTINKAQGQTFEKVGLYLIDPVFSHGQLYVAFSRVKSVKNIFVKLPYSNTRTKNIVYREIL